MTVLNSQRWLGTNVYPEVPDGGWGWAVAAAFFVVEVCTYGTLKSLGVFLQDLIDEFGESNSRVSWVISICVFIFTFTGQSLFIFLFCLLVRPSCSKNTKGILGQLMLADKDHLTNYKDKGQQKIF